MTYIRLLRIFISFFIYCAATCLFVDAQTNNDSIKSLNEVTIQSFKQKSSIQQLPYSVQSVSKKDLQRTNARTLPESMMYLPGVMIQKSNHGGGSPFIRGLTGNQALIVVDGIRLNNSIFRYGPNQYMNLIEPDLIDKVEILKGSGAVQYGSDALTGVIHLETNQLSFSENPKWNAKLNTRFTNRSMEKSVRPSLGYQSKNISIQASAAFKEFGDLVAGSDVGRQSPSGYNESSQHIKAMIQLGKGWTLKSSYQQLYQPDVPVFFKYVFENFKTNTSAPINRSMGYAILNKKFKSGKFDELKFYISRQRIEETRKLQKNGSTQLRTENDAARTIGFGTELKNTFSSSWHATTGIDVYSDLVNSTRADQSTLDGSSKSLRGLYPDNSRYQSFSVYHLHHLAWRKFQLEAGTRYNRYKAIIEDATLGKVNMQPKALIFQAGASYQLMKNLFVYGNISEGFRAPNIDDLGTLGIVDFRYEKPNYDLQPEKSLNTEVGIKLYNKRIQAEASVFRTGLRNLITRIKTNQNIVGYDVYEKENVDKGYIKGAEVSMQVNTSKHVYIKGNLTYLYGQSITRNEPLRRIPPLTTNLISGYRFKDHEIGMIYSHADPQKRLAQGDKDDVRIGKNGTAGFNVVSLFSRFNFKHFTTQVYINNLTNTVYKTHGSGVYEMGRSVTVSFSFFL
ncbi:MAG: TonB-dependent receptor plug domain-containing protein [Bacteroidota bacterium]